MSDRCTICGTLQDEHYDGVLCPIGYGVYSGYRKFTPAEPASPSAPEGRVSTTADQQEIMNVARKSALREIRDEFQGRCGSCCQEENACWLGRFEDVVNGLLDMDAPAAPETPRCNHESVNEGIFGDEGYMVVCNECGEDLSPAAPATPQLPPLTKPMRNSKHWDAGVDWPLAGERAARLEREDQLSAALSEVATLREENTDLKATCELLKSDLRSGNEVSTEYIAKLAAIQKKMDALRQWVVKAPHLPDCKFREWLCGQRGCDMFHTTPCSCGLDAAIALREENDRLKSRNEVLERCNQRIQANRDKAVSERDQLRAALERQKGEKRNE
jgi:hypothetical protein